MGLELCSKGLAFYSRFIWIGSLVLDGGTLLRPNLNPTPMHLHWWVRERWYQAIHLCVAECVASEVKMLFGKITKINKYCWKWWNTSLTAWRSLAMHQRWMFVCHRWLPARTTRISDEILSKLAYVQYICRIIQYERMTLSLHNEGHF